MAEIKISELEPTTDLEGLYTIGSDKNNLSKKVSLQFLREAADYAIEQGDYAKQEGSTIESRITDFKAETDAKLTELESETQRIYTTDNLITSLSQFELGNVSDVNGTLIDHPNRRRTDLLTLPLDAQGLPFALNSRKSDDVDIRAVWYDENKAFISGTNHLTPPTNARYVRLVATPFPDKAFSESLLLSMIINVYAEDLTNDSLWGKVVDLRERIFGSVELEYGSIRADGSLVDSSSRARTFAVSKNFVVETNDNFLVYEIYIFDKSSNARITMKEVNSSRYESDFDEANSYIKVLFRAKDNSDIADLRNIIKSFDNSEILAAKREIKVLDHNLNKGIIYENKGINGTSNTSRLISEYIAIPHHSTYRITIPQGYNLEYLLYKEEGDLYYESTYYEGTAIVSNGECNFMRLYIRKVDDKTIYSNEGAKFTITSGGAEKLTLRLAQWNMGYMNMGNSPSGMADSEMTLRIPEVKQILTKLNADILFVNENSVRVNQGNEGKAILQTYETFMQQFFPYRFVGGESMAIYSKFPIVCKELTLSVGTGRKYIKVEWDIVGLLLIHSSPYSDEDRLAENQEFVDVMSNYQYAVIAGDFNTGNNREGADSENAQISIFKNGGYVLGNRGYWGNKVTYPSTEQVLDNIIAKGMNIDNYEVLDNASVSDHLPTFADISLVL